MHPTPPACPYMDRKRPDVMAMCPGFDPVVASGLTVAEGAAMEILSCAHLGIRVDQGRLDHRCCHPEGIPLVADYLLLPMRRRAA